MKILNDDPIDSWVSNGLYALLYKVLDSTNVKALHLMAENKIAGPTAIISESQTQGRGQLQTKWHSSPNLNLTFTLALPKLSVAVNDQFKLNKAVCLAILQSLDEYTSELKIKWPNDIYWEQKKLAGVLIENQIQGVKIKSSVIGIGLNVNEKVWAADIPNPVSLSQITGQEIDLNSFRQKFIGKFYAAFNFFMKQGMHSIDQLYSAQMLRINEWGKFFAENLEFDGKIIGTDNSGNLLVENKNGIVNHYHLKSIKFVF
jgi:BirA family biotin operon repressor/biotin-[acetyl-CoA-carboxylase] ligase